MVLLPTAEALTPCLTSRLTPARRAFFKDKYRIAKKYGFRVAFAGVTGASVVNLGKEVAKETVYFHGKKYLGLILCTCGLTIFTIGVPILSNTTKVVKYGRACHSACAAAWRVAHNVAEFPLILCDYALFGEHVPSCGECDYDFYSTNVTDVVASFLD